MSPLNKTIVAKLNQMYETLDNIQEIWSIQGNQELMHELGETMGHIDNAIDIIKEKEQASIGFDGVCYSFCSKTDPNISSMYVGW